MAAILLAYFGTMVTVFAGIMYCLASLLDSGSMHHLRPHPYKMTVAARAMAGERMAAERAAANSPTGTVPAKNVVAASAPLHASDAVADNARPADVSGTRNAERQVQKTRQAKLARSERRQLRLASRSLDQGNAALGYAPESPTRIAADRIFSSINSRRY